jgi:alkyl sulfatase BDS1-like metallo-beta-lactamase superfamily hydrolase
MLRAMTPEMIFDYLGINADTRQIENLNGTINVKVQGDHDYLLTIKSGVVLYQKDASAKNADLTITLPAPAIALLISPEIKTNKNVTLKGDVTLLDKLQAAIKAHDTHFNIIEP